MSLMSAGENVCLCPIALPPASGVQYLRGIWVYQYRESVSKLAGFGLHQGRSLAFDAAPKNSAQTQQRGTAANLAALASAIADDFAVGAQDRIQERDCIELKFPLMRGFHGGSLTGTVACPGTNAELRFRERSWRVNRNGRRRRTSRHYCRIGSSAGGRRL